MIQLYNRGNIEFNNNGNHVLHPESCEVVIEPGAAWKMTLVHPIDSGSVFKDIIEESVICAPTPIGKKQLFRVYNTVKTDDDVTAYARPIFFDAAHDTMLNDVRPTNKTGQNALNIICGGSKYSATSDISKVNTAYYQNMNLIAALFGDDDNSYLNRWGGEPVFDNYKAIINERAGSDKGVRVEFGRNLDGIEEDINMENVVTRIYPKAYNGYMLKNNGYVDSPLVNNYEIVYSKVIEYSDVKLQSDCQEDEEGYINLDYLRAELVRRCNAEFENGIDKPEASYKVNMIDLSRTEEYKDYVNLETVGFGDTVHVRNKKLNIESTVRVKRIVYDCISQKNISEELGDSVTDFIDQFNSTVQRAESAFNIDGSVKGEKISGVIDAMNVALKASRGIAEKQKSRAILFEDLDPGSTTYGAMALGTTGFQIASKRNADNTDWEWSTCGTGQGFLANMIIAGVLYSRNYIEGKQGIKLNLDEGSLEANNFQIQGKGAPDYINDEVSSAVEHIGEYDIYSVDEEPDIDNYPANQWYIPIYPSDTLYPSDDFIWEYDYTTHVNSVSYTPNGTCYVFRHKNGSYFWEIMAGTEVAYVLSKVAELKVADGEISSAVAETKETLKNDYYTIVQSDSKMKQTADEINLSVSKNYTTLTQSGKIKEDLQSEIEQTATNITTTVSNTYTTKESTKVMKSQIDQNATNITSKVSNGEISSKISQEAGAISFNANRLSWISDGSRLLPNGSLYLSHVFINVKNESSAPSIQLGSSSGYSSVLDSMQLDFLYSSSRTYINNSTVSTNNGIFTNLNVSGSKRRIVDTKTYGTVSMNAFESMGAYFSDIGSGTVIDNVSVVMFDCKFLEVIEEGTNYQVFITNTSDKGIYNVKKHDGFFEVYGDPEATFDWMIVAKQRDYADLYGDTYEQEEVEKSHIPKTNDENMLDDFVVDFDLIYDEILEEQEREVTLI